MILYYATLHDIFPFFESNFFPLQADLLNHVTLATFGLTVRLRSFIKTNCMLKADEPHAFGFPSVVHLL